MKEEKKNNVFVDFILAFIYIPVYALRGIKFILFDIWVLIFNYLTPVCPNPPSPLSVSSSSSTSSNSACSNLLIII